MSQVSYDFSGRVALVTGGSNGIGAEIARHYHSAGAQVVIWDIAEARELDFSHHFSQVDISQSEQIAKAMDELRQRFGRLDFLAHCAGFAGATGPLVDCDEQQWQRVIDVNLVGTFKLCQAVVPLMLAGDYGRIVNLASLAGKEGTPNASAYSAAKAGVIGLTKSLGKELAMTPVRVNCVAPAAVKTAILEQMSPEFVQIMIDKSPMQRLGEVEEVAQMAMWLSSDSCSFNTGAVFDLSGGRSVY